MASSTQPGRLGPTDLSQHKVGVLHLVGVHSVAVVLRGPLNHTWLAASCGWGAVPQPARSLPCQPMACTVVCGTQSLVDDLSLGNHWSNHMACDVFACITGSEAASLRQRAECGTPSLAMCGTVTSGWHCHWQLGPAEPVTGWPCQVVLQACTQAGA